MRFRWWLGGFVQCAALFVAGPAFAQAVTDQTRAAARNLGTAGVEAYETGDYAVASTKLEKAYGVLKVPSLGLWSARALVKLGKLVEGAERYLEVTRLTISGGDQTVQGKAQQEAARELEALTPKIPNLVIQIQGVDEAKVQVTIDGQPVAPALIGERQPMNPGRYVVRGQLGERRQEAEVEIKDGERSVVLAFQPEGSAPPADAQRAAQSDAVTPSADASGRPARPTSNTVRNLGWVSLVAGGGAVIGGGVAGLVVINWKNQIDRDPTLATDSGNRERYETWRVVSIATLATGGALTLLGGVLLVSTKGNEAKVSLELGPARASVRGAF